METYLCIFVLVLLTLFGCAGGGGGGGRRSGDLEFRPGRLTLGRNRAGQ